MSELHKNIKKLRIDKHWTQSELAERVGYADKSMISRIEKGTVNLPASQIEKFAQVFGVPASDLIGETHLQSYTFSDFKTITPETMRLAATLQDVGEGEAIEVIRIGRNWHIVPKTRVTSTPLPKRVVVRRNGRLLVKKKPTLIPIVQEDEVKAPTMPGRAAKRRTLGKKKKLVPT
jgi:transcriptional regulator with XRE-family HTH domain